MELKNAPFCPLIKKDCKQLGCSWFTQVRGRDPQTGRDIDEWGCAITWLPVLLIANANEARQGAAATESFRNAVMGVQRAPGTPPNAAAQVAEVIETVATPPQIKAEG